MQLPDESQRNGNITIYSIEYRLVGESSFTTVLYVPDNHLDTSHLYSLSGLSGGRMYEVRVAAMTSVGLGPFTNTTQFVPAPSERILDH